MIWLRCGNISTIEMHGWLAGTFAEALRRIELGEACVEIPFDRK
jgi:predicted nuclease of predicted toxin-antitoxin system